MGGGKSNLIILFDGDIGRYRWAFAAEKTRYLMELVNPSGHKEWQEFDTKKGADEYGVRVTKGIKGASFTVWSRKEIQPVENALQIAKASLQQTIDEIESKYEESKLLVYLTGDSNFRDEVAKTKKYKGNRDNTPRPVHYDALGEYLVNTWAAVYTEGYEADDAIGIAAMEAKAGRRPYVVVSNDKDLDQIPGLHYDWITKELYTVSAKEARKQFYQQLLSGDSTDNIPGLPGIGKVKAAEALAECKTPAECLETVIKMYQDHSFTTYEHWETYLKEQADLVYILKRPGEKWSDTKEGKEFVAKYLTTD